MTDETKTPDDTPILTQEMIDAALRQRALALAATQGGNNALSGMYGGSLLPEVSLRAQCLQSVITIGLRDPKEIISVAQSFYDFMVDKPKAATLHAVKPAVGGS